MMFRYLTLLILTFSLESIAVGRKPAVEDFVGIEMDHPETNPQGTDSLFNFEKDISAYQETKHVTKTARITSEKIQGITWSISKIFAVFLAIGFPTLVWIFAINNLRKKASIQNAGNIEVLEKYRKERELAKRTENSKKAA